MTKPLKDLENKIIDWLNTANPSSNLNSPRRWLRIELVGDEWDTRAAEADALEVFDSVSIAFRKGLENSVYAPCLLALETVLHSKHWVVKFNYAFDVKRGTDCIEGFLTFKSSPDTIRSIKTTNIFDHSLKQQMWSIIASALEQVDYEPSEARCWTFNINSQTELDRLMALYQPQHVDHFKTWLVILAEQKIRQTQIGFNKNAQFVIKLTGDDYGLNLFYGFEPQIKQNRLMAEFVDLKEEYSIGAPALKTVGPILD